MTTKTNTVRPIETLEQALTDVKSLDGGNYTGSGGGGITPNAGSGGVTEHPKSTDAIGDRLESSIDLIQNYLHEQLGTLRAEIDHTEKLLHTDCERARTVCQDMVRSASTIQTLKASASETLSALRSGRARLVPVKGEP